ncbi:MAG: hypothetical protein H5T45_01975 [Thermoplasmatales archaeon]|nr:hypothetical protein [Thermoplasmatales archaeon]
MRQDRISGASEIENKFIRRIKKFLGKKNIFDECLSFLSLYPSMGSIWNIANFSFIYGEDAIKKFELIEKANDGVLKNSMKLNFSKILTYSRSSTVEKFFLSKEAEVICSEARPRYEGRILAKNLSGKKVTLVADCAIYSFIKDVYAVIVGADAILDDGIVNKVGTYPLAVFAKMNKKPFYVLSSSYKRFPFVAIKEENREEIWKTNIKNLKIRNFYFDFTPHKFISFFVTERGINKKIPEFREEISDEIIKIKDILEKRKYFTLGSIDN